MFTYLEVFRKILKINIYIVLTLSTVSSGLAYANGLDEFKFEHVDQMEIFNFEPATVIDWGAMLFSTDFTAEHGVGSNLSMDLERTIKFTRLPRMDLPGFANNPTRTTGPNSVSCVACHGYPFVGGAGEMHDMEIRDPFRSGDPDLYVQRNPLHLFGSGALQLIAEKVTQELFQIRQLAIQEALAKEVQVVTQLVTSDGINYGSISVASDGEVSTEGVVGISADLILRPYTYKGSFITFLRPLVSLGADTQMGMPTVEFFGSGNDSDFDGHVDEMSVGDITAMTLYIASLPRPVTQLELDRFVSGKHKLPMNDIEKIQHGKSVFSQIGCDACHKPSITLSDSLFKEPSAYPMHRFPKFPSGQDPIETGLDSSKPYVVDLAINPQIGSVPNDSSCRELAANVQHKGESESNRQMNCFLQYKKNQPGDGIEVELYGDLKWHDMGEGLAENVDEAGTGKSVWKTRELWGTGNTGPWLHDGRATTLSEAIMWHGGEALPSRDEYTSLSDYDRGSLIRFLQNLVLYVPE